MKVKYLIGIDEAGRGPLAGPVAVGLIKVPVNFNVKLLNGVRDSKKLSEQKREEHFKNIKELQKAGKLQYAVTLVDAKIIDKKGITFAIKRAIKSNLKKVHADCKTCSIFLDGSLKAPEEFLIQQTIIKGDDKIPVISAASVMAKVTRDRKMKKLALEYPQYALEIHKGYGTQNHLKLIKKHGISAIHRASFLTRFS